MDFEVQARAGDVRSLGRLLATTPSSLKIGSCLVDGVLVAAHPPHPELGAVVGRAGPTALVIEVEREPVTSLAEVGRAVRPFLPRVAVASFDERLLIEVRRRSAAATTFLFDRPSRVATVADTLGPRHDLVTAELVRAAHTVGLRVVPWVVNDVRRLTELLALGVDGVVTDEPALAREVAASRASLAA